nr:iron ABC transporter permease [Tomitella gaofuii]
MLLLWLAGLVAALVLTALLSVALGSRVVGMQDVFAALGGDSSGFDRAAVTKRIPRTALALLAGAALAVSGAVLQGITRNPVADSGILGIDMGASLAVVTGIAMFGLTSASSYAWVAIAGAAVTAVGVYTVGSLGRGGATPLKLTLAGAATAAALVSLISAVVLPRGDIADSVRSWQIGGVGGGDFATIGPVLPFLIAGFVLALACARGLDLLSLGDELAAGLGARVAVTRVAAAGGAVVLCGASTALTGPIGFVGLMVPHAVRLLVGVGYRWIIPFSAVGGALLVTAADVFGRVVARPTEIDVGIITALIGAPLFIAIVRRQRVREL